MHNYKVDINKYFMYNYVDFYSDIHLEYRQDVELYDLY